MPLIHALMMYSATVECETCETPVSIITPRPLGQHIPQTLNQAREMFRGQGTVIVDDTEDLNVSDHFCIECGRYTLQV